MKIKYGKDTSGYSLGCKAPHPWSQADATHIPRGVAAGHARRLQVLPGHVCCPLWHSFRGQLSVGQTRLPSSGVVFLTFVSCFLERCSAGCRVRCVCKRTLSRLMCGGRRVPPAVELAPREAAAEKRLRSVVGGAAWSRRGRKSDSSASASISV